MKSLIQQTILKSIRYSMTIRYVIICSRDTVM